MACFTFFKFFPHRPSYLTVMTFSLASVKGILVTGPFATFPADSPAFHPRHLRSSHLQPFVVFHTSMLLYILPSFLCFWSSLSNSVHPVNPCHPSGSRGRVSHSISLSPHPRIFCTIPPRSLAVMHSGGPLPKLPASPG